MSVIDDLRDAVANYATDNCTTTIEEFSVTTGEGTHLNFKDEFQFKVKVSNDGELDMKNVKIRVNGSNWAQVALSGSTGVFGSSALLDAPLNIDAKNSFTTGFFRGKATAATDDVAEIIVTAQIDGWDGVLDHILNDHSGAGKAEGTLTETVLPS